MRTEGGLSESRPSTVERDGLVRDEDRKERHGLGAFNLRYASTAEGKVRFSEP